MTLSSWSFRLKSTRIKARFVYVFLRSSNWFDWVKTFQASSNDCWVTNDSFTISSWPVKETQNTLSKDPVNNSLLFIFQPTEKQLFELFACNLRQRFKLNLTILSSFITCVFKKFFTICRDFSFFSTSSREDLMSGFVLNLLIVLSGNFFPSKIHSDVDEDDEKKRFFFSFNNKEARREFP